MITGHGDGPNEKRPIAVDNADPCFVDGVGDIV